MPSPSIATPTSCASERRRGRRRLPGVDPAVVGGRPRRLHRRRRDRRRADAGGAHRRIRAVLRGLLGSSPRPASCSCRPAAWPTCRCAAPARHGADVPQRAVPRTHMGSGSRPASTFEEGPATIVGFGPPTAVATRSPRDVRRPPQRTGLRAPQRPERHGHVRRPGAGRASRAWIDAGPAHHLALMRGDRRQELRAAGRFLDVEFIEIGPRGRVP